MTPKEKACELVDKMYFSRRFLEEESYVPLQAFNHAKECALIAVDVIINALEIHQWQNKSVIEYYLEVKQEIEKIRHRDKLPQN